MLKTSLSKQTAIKHLQQLEEKKIILSKKRGGKLSKIYIVYPLVNIVNLDENIRKEFNIFMD